MRCYIAIELEEAVSARIEAAVVRLRQLSPSTRWVRPGFLHLTLAFLGEVADAKLPQISAEVEKVARAHPPLTLVAQGSGMFGTLSHPRVLWVALNGEVRELAAIELSLRRAMAGLEFHPEYESYQAHITLGRAKNPKGDPGLSRCAAAIRDTAFGEMKVGELVVFASNEEPGGLRYDAISRHALGR